MGWGPAGWDLGPPPTGTHPRCGPTKQKCSATDPWPEACQSNDLTFVRQMLAGWPLSSTLVAAAFASIYPCLFLTPSDQDPGHRQPLACLCQPKFINFQSHLFHQTAPARPTPRFEPVLYQTASHNTSPAMVQRGSESLTFMRPWASPALQPYTFVD